MSAFMIEFASRGNRLAVLVASLALWSGCGGGADGPEMFPVTGTVSFDGEPVETGRILFRSGGGQAFSAEIVEGEYALDAEAGNMQVQVTASRPIPGKFDKSNPDDEPQPVGEMYIPAQYNAKSELTAEVSPEGENHIPFDLHSAK